MKKFFAVLLTTLMVLAVASTAMAAGSRVKPSGHGGGGGGGGSTPSGSSANANAGGPGGMFTTGKDGNWIMNSITDWNYRLNDGTLLRSRWAYVYNPYANSTDWFYFDPNGTMLYGWQWVRDMDGVTRLYYLHTAHDGNFGKCHLGGTVEGQTLSATGAVTVNGVVQTR